MVSIPTKPRKERERLARQEEILDAARQVFSARGFEKAKLDEIAEVAELGKGTIYNYFKSKEDLFVSVIVRGIRRFQEFISQAVQDQRSPQDKVAAYIGAAFAFFRKHHQLFSIFELEKSNLARSLSEEMNQTFCEKEAGLIQFLEQLFFEGIKTGAFKQFDAQKLAQTVFGMIHVTCIHAARTPEEFDPEKEAQFLKRLIFEGIRSRKT